MEARIVSEINRKLAVGKAVALIRILACSGSSPRDEGSVCLVDEDGELTGSIGGGLVEFRAVSCALKRMQESAGETFHFSLTAEEEAREGLLCGRRVELYIELFSPGERQVVELFQHLESALSEGKEAVLITRRIEGGRAGAKGARRLFVDSICVASAMQVFERPFPAKEFQLIETAEDSYICESIAPRPRLRIFGAGHIGMSLADLSKNTCFSVFVVDERSGYATKQRFPLAEEVHALHYEKELFYRPVMANDFIVITTPSHKSDEKVLELVLNSGVKGAYLGMIGSRRKRDIIFQRLAARGVGRALLDTVRCPVGLDIKAVTPEEIAISILAEIIKAKNVC